MLRPQYTRRPFEILIIGPANSGKRTIATQLLKLSDVFYSVNLSEIVPKNNVERVDFILLVVDMTQLLSLQLLDEILKKLTVGLLYKKVCVVVTKIDKRNRWEFEIEDIQDILSAYYNLQTFYVNLMSEVEKKRFIQQVSKLIKINTLQYKNVNSMILKTVEMHSVNEDSSKTSDEDIEPILNTSEN